MSQGASADDTQLSRGERTMAALARLLTQKPRERACRLVQRLPAVLARVQCRRDRPVDAHVEQCLGSHLRHTWTIDAVVKQLAQASRFLADPGAPRARE